MLFHPLRYALIICTNWKQNVLLEIHYYSKTKNGYSKAKLILHVSTHRGRDRIVVGFIATYAISAYNH